jgi:hypothetical protein
MDQNQPPEKSNENVGELGEIVGVGFEVFFFLISLQELAMYMTLVL